jgi:hypothetical protein
MGVNFNRSQNSIKELRKIWYGWIFAGFDAFFWVKNDDFEVEDEDCWFLLFN